MSRQKAISCARQEFYTTNDVAEIMGCGREKARLQMKRWEAEGKAFKFGGSLVIRIAIFDAENTMQDGFDKAVGYRNFKIIRGKRKA